MTKNKIIPDDFKVILQLLASMIPELSDAMGKEVKEWRIELYREIGSWKFSDDEEPDWDYYRSELNRICSEDGMPNLFEEIKDESS